MPAAPMQFRLNQRNSCTFSEKLENITYFGGEGDSQEIPKGIHGSSKLFVLVTPRHESTKFQNHLVILPRPVEKSDLIV